MITTLKRVVFPTVTTALSMWTIAGLWHNLLMPTLYADSHAKHDGIGMLLVAYFVLALFMTYLYPRLRGDSSTAVAGLRLGVVVGLLWVFPHGLAMAGAHDESLAYVFKNGLWHVVEQGLGGLVLAFSLWLTSAKNAGAPAAAALV